MKNINFQKDILPHIVALIIFFVITLLFYSPMIFSNKTLALHDVQQGMGGGQEIKEFREATGEEALWTNSMFGGMPAYLISTDWGDDVLWGIYNVVSFGLPSPASLTLIGMISFYLLLLIAGVRPWVSMLGAIGFSLSSFMLISIGAGHIWKIRAVAFAPLVIAGFYLLFEKNNRLWGFILSALGLALEIWSNHLQITYYLMLLLSLFGISVLVLAIKNKSYNELLKNIGIVVLAVILAVASNLDRLWSTYEYGKYSTRGKTELTKTAGAKSGLERDYVFNWSHGISESFTLLIPYFNGGASQQSLSEDSNVADALRAQGANPAQVKQNIEKLPTYWGDQPYVGGPIYAGAIICFFFVLGVIVLENKYKVWLIAGVALSLVLAWGSNFSSFNYLMYDLFPGYNKFRAVSMAIIIALWCMPLLGALGLEKLMCTGINAKTQKQLLIAFGATGGLSLIFAMLAGMFSFQGAVDGQLPEWLLSAIRSDRESMMRGDAIRSFALITASALTIYLILKGKLKEMLGVGLLLIFMFFDLFTVDKRYFNNDNFTKNANRTFFAQTNADKQIKQDKGSYRVLNLLNPWNEARTSYHHQSIGGYHGAKPKRTAELIDYCLGSQVNISINKLRSQSTDFSDLSVLNMLNAKYLTFGNEAGNVVPNSAAFGNAWLVSTIEQVQNADEEIAATCALKSSATAVIDVSKFQVPEISYDSSSNISLKEYKPNQLTYQASINQANALAVFSEIYYPAGWEATIDGVEVDILRANYILRALEVPRGEHNIVFSFKPDSYYIGNKVANASSIILLLLVIGGIVLSIKKIL